MEYITEVLMLDKDFPFAIYNGKGFSHQDEKNNRVYMHNHHSLEINFCVSGEGQYTIIDDKYPILQDDIFIINNLEYHMARNLSGDLQLMVIVFDPELILAGSNDYQYVRAFYEWKTGFKHRLPGGIFATEEIKGILNSIQEEWDTQAAGWRLVVKSLLLMLLALLYRRFESMEGYSEKIRHFQKGYIKLAPAIRYMEEHYKENIPLATLAQEAHMSVNYFSAYFSQNMNCTVSEYLIRMRLKHACMQLTTTDNSILSVALESGFENISYFNRVFRKEFGVTPRQYRKRVDGNGKKI